MKHVVPRELANRDVEEAIEHYLAQANAKVALGFIPHLPRRQGRRCVVEQHGPQCGPVETRAGLVELGQRRVNPQAALAVS